MKLLGVSQNRDMGVRFGRFFCLWFEGKQGEASPKFATRPCVGNAGDPSLLPVTTGANLRVPDLPLQCTGSFSKRWTPFCFVFKGDQPKINRLGGPRTPILRNIDLG